jgi:hypothetical protein
MATRNRATRGKAREWWIVYRGIGNDYRPNATVPMNQLRDAKANAREFGGEILRVREVRPKVKRRG